VSAAERGTFDGRPPDGTASLASGLALVRAALAPHGVERMLVDARLAFDLEPPGSNWYTLAAMLVGVGQFLNGFPEQAAQALERAAHYGTGAQASAVGLALAELALLAAGHGDWPAAETFAAESWAVIDRANLHDYVASVATHVARATVAAHRRDTDAATRYAGAALHVYARPSPVAFPWLGSQMAIALGRLFLELGDRPAALIKVREARRHLARLVSPGLLLAEQLRQLADDVARHGGRSDVGGPLALTAAELRVLQLLPTHLSLAEIAHELHVTRNTVKAQVAAVYRKLRASTRAEAVRHGSRLGLLGS
jgi:LuxR family maltose regulon positive regulatory protein